jgi:hypothetical protein
MAQALLSRRLQFFKSEGDGFFAQHPQDLRLWYEVAGDRVYGYEVETNLGHDFVLRDKSVPRRKAKYAKLNRNGVSFGSTAQGPWGSIEKLHCKEPECLFVAPYGKAPRRVWKFKGGWFNDVCDGQVWQGSLIIFPFFLPVSYF